jgi:hypothetical protein
MATFQTVRADIECDIDSNLPVMLWGAPGIGKSDMMREIAAARGVPLIDWRANLREPIDVRGLPTIDIAARRTVWLQPEDLPDADRDGPEGILFIDEIVNAAPSMQAALYGLVLDRRIGDYVLPAGWRIVAAGNRMADRSSASRMPLALANRFSHYVLEPDADAWRAWAEGAGVHPLVVAFMGFRPNLLHVMPGPDAMAFPSPRSWAAVSRIADSPDGALYRRAAAKVGEGAAAEFQAFAKAWRNLPSLATILREPETAPVPSDPAAVYAVASLLSRKADRINLPAIVRYAERLGGDYERFVVTDAARRDNGLKATGAYVAWAARNADSMI